MGNYIETWRMHTKLERVYVEGRTTRDILKAADNTTQLMKGTEFPSGFSLSVIEGIGEKMNLISKHSMTTKMMEWMQPKHARNMHQQE